MQAKIKPSLIELGLKAKTVAIMGIGGGGDVIQGIPVANLMRQLGVETILMGGVSCQWWTADGEPLADDWGSAVMGPTVYDANALAEAEPLTKNVMKVNVDSHLDGRKPCEARLAETLPADVVFIASLKQGVVGLAEGLNELVQRYQVDLFIGVDIGSDTFCDGEEASPIKTALSDFTSMSAMLQLPCAVAYGVSGYGCDGEMHLEELDARVARVMQAGGYLGAHGLTQQDVVSMKAASEVYPDPVEPMSYRAAQGEFGLKNVWTHGPHGTVVKVTPLAAVMMFFDPHVMAEVNSKGILALSQTQSLAEVESIFKHELKLFPESKMHPVIQFFEDVP